MKTQSRPPTQLRSLTGAGRFVEERGATAVEYARIASMIAAVVAGTVAVLGTTVLGLFQSVSFP